jgi:hypothetical protein
MKPSAQPFRISWSVLRFGALVHLLHEKSRGPREVRVSPGAGAPHLRGRYRGDNQQHGNAEHASLLTS